MLHIFLDSDMVTSFELVIWLSKYFKNQVKLY